MQLFTFPVKFSLLNLDLGSLTVGDWPAKDPTLLLEYLFDLSQKV